MMSPYGVIMPQIIYGTAWKQERTATLVKQAISLGFRGIDTACQPKHYHEAGVGAGIAACLNKGLERSELYLQTKFTSVNGQDPLRIPYDAKASLAEQVAQSFQASLKNLQTPYLDCLVLHSPMPNPQQTLAVWQVMTDIFHSGAVKQLGISNCYKLQDLEALYHTVEIKPAVLQNRFYADSQYDRGIRDFCQQQGIVYQSFWTLSANPYILADTLLQTLAKQYRRSAAQVLFRYLTQIGIVPLTGTASAKHMAEDLAIFEFKLTGDECVSVEALL
jgi:diketogulonate reductase-like aldo/keto reductase